MFGVGLHIWDPMGGMRAPQFESCIVDGTIQILYDSAPGRGLVGAAGVVISWTPVIGGTASDVLVPLGTGAIYNIADAGFGNRPSAEGDGIGCLQSVTPASAVLVAQPDYIVAIQRESSVLDTGRVIADGAAAGLRQEFLTNATPRVQLYSGSTVTSTMVPIVADYNTKTIYWNGAASTIRRRRSSGAISNAGPVNPGANSIRGVTMFSTYINTAPGTGRLTIYSIITGLSVADQTRIDAWCQSQMGWV